MESYSFINFNFYITNNNFVNKKKNNIVNCGTLIFHNVFSIMDKIHIWAKWIPILYKMESIN